MKKIAYTILGLVSTLVSYAQSDCYITYKYDNSGNRIDRSYNCPPPATTAQFISVNDSSIFSKEGEKIEGMNTSTYSIVYPNPNSGKFWIEFKNRNTKNSEIANPIRKIYLMNALGQVLLELASSNQKVYLEAKSIINGNYILVIYDGIKQTSHKITIKN